MLPDPPRERPSVSAHRHLPGVVLAGALQVLLCVIASTLLPVLLVLLMGGTVQWAPMESVGVLGLIAFIALGGFGTSVINLIDLPGRIGRRFGWPATPWALPGAVVAATLGGLVWWLALATCFTIIRPDSPFQETAPMWANTTLALPLFSIGAGVRGGYALSRGLTSPADRPGLIVLDMMASIGGWTVGVAGALALLPVAFILNMSSMSAHGPVSTRQPLIIAEAGAELQRGCSRLRRLRRGAGHCGELR